MEQILTFLDVKDYDNLSLCYEKLGSLTDDDYFVINNVLEKWDDEQAIINLMLYSELIPQKNRWKLMAKALECYDTPSYIIAAIVGLQRVETKLIDDFYKKYFTTQLLRFCNTNTYLLAKYASNTVRNFIDESNCGSFLEVYPSANESVNKNIINSIVLLFQKSTLYEFKKKLKKMGIGWLQRKPFIDKLNALQKGDITSQSLEAEENTMSGEKQ